MAGGCCLCRYPGSTVPGGGPLPVLDSIVVEDPLEAALLQQELGLKPYRVVGRTLYYEDTGLAPRLIALGYQPQRAVSEAVVERLVRVHRRKKAGAREEQALQEAGALIVLRERNYWIVRASVERLRLLSRLGFRLEGLGGREPRPRQVLVQVATLEQVGAVARAGVDIYAVAPAPVSPAYEQQRRGYVISGGAFDYAIDTLREQGFEVTLEPDPPGVVR
jgi:hypothetical protein